jgi:hypothetical protein
LFDPPRTARLVRHEGAATSQSAFDDRTTVPLTGESAGSCRHPGYFVYDVVLPPAGQGVATGGIAPEQVHRLERTIAQCGPIGGLYCPSRTSPQYSKYRTSLYCSDLPDLKLAWYGPHVLALKAMDGTVAGLLWQSVTGYDIAQPEQR